MSKESIRGEHDLIDERLDTRNTLIEQGVNPYPLRSNPTHHQAELNKAYEDLEPDERTDDEVTVTGRIMRLRNMGKICFLDLQRDGAITQVFLDEEGTRGFELLDDIDLGDFLEVEGTMMKSRTGEVTVKATRSTLLTKSVRPLPDKYHGVQDTEIKYRKRYLDTLTNKESLETFKKRSQLLRLVRDFLEQRGFLEVETPILHEVYGGAAAKPFTTYHNDMKQDLYLRISPELYLKRLLVGGFDKVFDINKNFRNESVDSTHNPEYTMLEAYAAYQDYEDMMELTEELFAHAAKELTGNTNVEYGDYTINFSTPWERITMLESIQKETGLHPGDMTKEELKQACDERGLHLEKPPRWGNYVQLLFEECCEHNIIQPTFVTDHPQSTTPLCKQTEHDERLVERFEPFCAGMEIANAYSELNDPVIQRELLVDQSKQREDGDEEAHPHDEAFLQAVEYGMPPAGGLGIGIDRMAMLLLNKQSIKDVILFPTMKKETNQ